MRTFPREVTRSERCIGLPPDIAGISGTLTGPSHSPARLFMVVKDFCASDGDWDKATVARDNRTTDSIKRWCFIIYSPHFLIWIEAFALC
jgi:hypothetical protein